MPDRYRLHRDRGGAVITDMNGNLVARLEGGDALKDAAYLVRAANEFSRLVATLRHVRIMAREVLAQVDEVE
jgi:hypothetical protein